MFSIIRFCFGFKQSVKKIKMKYLFVLCTVLAVSCSAFGALETNHAVAVRSRRDVMAHSVKLIEDLVANLQKAAQDGLDAVGNFTTGVVRVAEEVREKILKDIENFRSHVAEAIERVFQRFSNTSTAVQECVDSHRNQAAVTFDETVSNTMICVDDRIAEVGLLIENLKSLANNTMGDATAAMEGLKKCTQENTNIMTTVSCLGAIAFQTEWKSLGFLTHSTILMARINLSLATLPAAVEVCAGTRIVQAGFQTGKIVLEIGSCSANAIVSNFTDHA